MDVTFETLFGAAIGCGLWLGLLGLRARPVSPPVRRHALSILSVVQRPENLAALAVGMLALVVTRWPMALPLGAAAVVGLRGLGPGTSNSAIDKLEAIASWTEMLRDTLAGASGLTQALVATADTAPPHLKPEIRSLSEKLLAGVALEPALRELGEEIADPSADLVIAALLMASRERAQRLGDLLGALALSIRDEVAMRLSIEASRTSSRTAVRMITGFSLGLFGLMAIFARTYLAPYRALTGQLVLGLVGLLFGLGLWLMAIMVRPQPLPRLELASSLAT